LTARFNFSARSFARNTTDACVSMHATAAPPCAPGEARNAMTSVWSSVIIW